METLQLDLDQESICDLKQALKYHVPDMILGFTIVTQFGEIKIEPEFSEAFRNLAADVLQYRLNKLRTY
jgi:hypothetical protein